MKDKKWAYIAFALVYIAFSLAIAVAVYITKSAWCLWGFLLMPKLSVGSDNGGEENE